MIKDYILPAAAIVIAGIFYLLSGQIPASRSTISVGPTFWPKTIVVFMIILSMVMIARTVIGKKREAAAEGTVEKNSQEAPEVKEVYPQNLWISFLLLMAYAYLMNVIGFVLATLLYLAISAWIMGTRRIAVLVPVVLVLTAALVWLFPKVLLVPLPRGIGFFRNITLLFY